MKESKVHKYIQDFPSLIAIMLDYDVRIEKYTNSSCIIDENNFFFICQY